MRKIKLFSLAFAAIAMLLASCVKKEENHLTPDEIFHVVHFETESSETKTTMDIEGSTVNFAWEETDYDVKLQRFHIWENENEAVRVEPKYSQSTKKLSLDATFTESLPEDPEYVGYFNGKVPALQVPRNNQYDADADVLIAESRKEEDQFVFYFQRVVAIGKLTLKDIEAGEKLQSVTFELAEESDQFLTASLERSDDSSDGWAWAETGKKITINCNHTIGSDGVAPALYFTAVPVNEGMFTVKAVTDKNTYSKTFGKAISLTRGNVKGMSVAMVKEEKPTSDYELTVSNAPSGYNNSASNIYNQNGIVFKAANIMKNGNNQPSGYNASQFIQMKASQCSLYNDTELSLITVKVIYLSGTFALQTKTKSSDSWSSAVTGTAGNQVISGLKTTSGASTIADTDAKANLKTLTYNLSGKKYFRIQPSATTHVYKIIVTVGESTPTGVKLATPANLSVNADKQIVWDRVENAGSYNVYINGGEAIPVTDHYYDASSVEDGYYNVAVEAVPANSEMFVTSDKATLTNAKFGTPTLATPAPEVAKTDKTITLTWDVDAHANGYTYTLYKGEDVVESPTANYSVAEGVATLVYSNLSPKTAYSVKVNATLVESPLRYEASEVYTTDDITTLSTINYAELHNGIYSENPAYAAVGEEVTFAATPANGYEFESVSVTGVEAANIERADEIFTFTMPDLAEVTVAVTFAPIGFTLGTSLLDSENDHGTVVINSPKERYTVTDVIALTVTPEDHYEVVEVEAVEDEGSNSIEATLNGETGKYEITGLHFNAELMASFKLIDYPITVADGIENGTVTRGSETATYNQENVSFTVKPSAGYQIATVTVSGASGEVTATAGATDEQGTHYTFTMPGEPVTINATFDAIDYTVTGVAVSQTCHGSVTADKATANIGETVTLTVTPEHDWYQLKANTLKVNGTITPTRVGETNQYTFKMPAANATVAAEFELVPYEVKDQTSSAEKGSLTFSVAGGAAATPVSATYNQLVTVVPVPDKGYEMTSLKLYKKGTQWAESNKVDYDPEALTFTQPAYAVSAKAEFVKKNYAITNNGVTSGTGSFVIKNSNGDVISSAQMGDVITLDAEYAEGFKVVWTVSDNVTDLKADATDKSKATFTMPAGEVTVSAAIEENVPALEVDFENAASTYLDWDFVNVVTQQSHRSVNAHGGSYFGSTGNGTDGTASASITTKNKIIAPQKLEFYVTKQSGNTSSSTWKVQTSTNNSTWTDVISKDAKSMDVGNWDKVSADLSTKSNVYVRISYSGSTAIRNIDDVVLEYAKPTKLSTPTNLNVADQKLTWNTVTNATGYTISITPEGGAEQTKTSATNSYSLSSFAAGKYTIKVMATADGYPSSDYSQPYECTLTGGQSETKSITFSSKYSSNTVLNGTAIAIDDNVSVTFATGGGTNPQYYVSGKAVRWYAKNTMEISAAAGKTITAITFTYGESDGSNAITITAGGGTFTSPNWSGSSNSVTFKVGGTSGNRRISAISVTYE